MESRIHITLSPAAQQALALRAEPVRSHGGTRTTGRENLSLPASDMIERYDRMVRGGIWQLKRREGFTPAHFCCACDALNGTLITPDTLNYISDEIAEAIRLDGLGEKWELGEGDEGIEAAAVLFDSLGALEQLALADLKERYWRGVTRGDNASPVEFWEKLGTQGGD